MKVTTRREKTVEQLIKGRDHEDMKVNHEYQRGLRWTPRQKQLFLDSVARGYPIPAFYLHARTKKNSLSEQQETAYEIVDGQQRIEALWEFWKGAFKIPDPAEDSGLPRSIREQECAWAGKSWDELDTETKERILETTVVIHECVTDDPNEVRDLFIRLQGGTPLSRQDKRDAWPGNFTEFVLKTAGKKELAQFPGEPLWHRLTANDSTRRQFAAQAFMQWDSMRRRHRLCDHGANQIDSFYHKNVDFNAGSTDGQAFLTLCQKVDGMLATRKGKLSAYMLLHTLLFVEAIKDSHVLPSGDALVSAIETFEKRLKAGRKADKEGRETPEVVFEQRFGRHTRAGSDSAQAMEPRHSFFLNQMMLLTKPRPKDEQRRFSGALRDAVYLRDKGCCMWCKMQRNDVAVPFDEMEIHHVVPHSEGGQTVLENGVVVHREHHPKTPDDVGKLREWWESWRKIGE